MKHTKIVCTIGPSSSSKTTLKKMMQAGMNVARLNFSHGDYADHTQLIERIRSVAQELKVPIALLQDLQGPRIRTGSVPVEGIMLKNRERVVLLSQKEYGAYDEDAIAIPIQYPKLADAVARGGTIYIQDGTIGLRVRQVRGKRIYCDVRQGGVVFSHKGINAPGATISGSVITKKDKEDIAFGVQMGVDYMALSFVKNARNIVQLKKLLPKKSEIKIIAKIERAEAIDAFDEIVDVSDGIMVARGDLGVEMGAAVVPILQKEMVIKCVRAGKPVIVATQMLESMTQNSRPTRAEAADVANAVIDHADALMLSAETATGKFPVEAVRTMSDIAAAVEKTAYDDLPHDDIAHAHEGTPIAVAHASLHVAQSIGATVVAVMTKTGETATAVSQLRPKDVKIVVGTPDERVLRQLSLIWGVHGVHITPPRNKASFIRQLKTAVKKRRLAKAGDEVVIITNFNRRQPGGVSEVITL